ncbi:hypothetical protein [Pseudomonas syringae]|uniref:hypothetical protein n=1 Tax=Pseudomonas syringae TaxID=317 RepID=UPI0011B7D391|nr:hypothetical protein [Pseudomonas syringae]
MEIPLPIDGQMMTSFGCALNTLYFGAQSAVLLALRKALQTSFVRHSWNDFSGSLLSPSIFTEPRGASFTDVQAQLSS